MTQRLTQRLTQRQLEILKLFENNENVTREEISKQLNLSDSTVNREIAVLKEKNVLIRQGSKYSGRWIVRKD